MLAGMGAVVLVGGQRISLRLLEPADGELIRAFYWRLSPETVYRRFMAPVVPPADALIQRLTDVDHCDREALVALDARGIAGIARYAASGDRTVHDIAVVVADDWQGHGLGRLLMTRLAHIARARGISSFHATLLGENRGAQAFVRRVWPRARMWFEAGLVEADIALRATA
jgi:GNAT superfamily N-acetyltransferase